MGKVVGLAGRSGCEWRRRRLSSPWSSMLNLKCRDSQPWHGRARQTSRSFSVRNGLRPTALRCRRVPFGTCHLLLGHVPYLSRLAYSAWCVADELPYLFCLYTKLLSTACILGPGGSVGALPIIGVLRARRVGTSEGRLRVGVGVRAGASVLLVEQVVDG